MRVQTPLGEWPAWGVVAANVAFWPCWSAAVGYVAHRSPAQRFATDGPLTRQRDFERGGAWYRERVGIGGWKDALPEAGALFGGFAKRSIGDGTTSELERFALETRRAERAHWGMASGVVLTTLWNPSWALPFNAAVAAAGNLPCIAVQRYNRARIHSVLRRRPRLT